MTETFALAARGFADLVRQIPPAAYSGPGLGVWDLRSLVGHTSRSLITVDSYLDRPAAREDLPTPEAYVSASSSMVAADPDAVAERGRQAGLALGEDPAATVTDLVERVLPRAAGAGDPLIETIAGGMRLHSYLPTRTFELVVHVGDITRATGLTAPDWPEAVWLEAVSLAARAAAVQGHGAQVLAALTGREPLPGGFSVV